MSQTLEFAQPAALLRASPMADGGTASAIRYGSRSTAASQTTARITPPAI